jgi:hypothetical protein
MNEEAPTERESRRKEITKIKKGSSTGAKKKTGSTEAGKGTK